MKPSRRTGVLLALAIVVAAVAFWWQVAGVTVTTAQAVPSVVDFNFHIRPILSDRCFKCHGPDAAVRKANLRLDTEAGLYQALKDDPSGRVIVPGEPHQSDLYLRLIAEDTSILMPPPFSHLTVTQEEVALIRKWIEQGAEYRRHWAFIPPEKQQPPGVKSDWLSNDIDRFVLAKLKER